MSGRGELEHDDIGSPENLNDDFVRHHRPSLSAVDIRSVPLRGLGEMETVNGISPERSRKVKLYHLVDQLEHIHKLDVSSPVSTVL